MRETWGIVELATHSRTQLSLPSPSRNAAEGFASIRKMPCAIEPSNPSHCIPEVLMYPGSTLPVVGRLNSRPRDGRPKTGTSKLLMKLRPLVYNHAESPASAVAVKPQKRKPEPSGRALSSFSFPPLLLAVRHAPKDKFSRNRPPFNQTPWDTLGFLFGTCF